MSSLVPSGILAREGDATHGPAQLGHPCDPIPACVDKGASGHPFHCLAGGRRRRRAFVDRVCEGARANQGSVSGSRTGAAVAAGSGTFDGEHSGAKLYAREFEMRVPGERRVEVRTREAHGSEPRVLGSVEFGAVRLGQPQPDLPAVRRSRHHRDRRERQPDRVEYEVPDRQVMRASRRDSRAAPV